MGLLFQFFFMIFASRYRFSASALGSFPGVEIVGKPQPSVHLCPLLRMRLHHRIIFRLSCYYSQFYFLCMHGLSPNLSAILRGVMYSINK